MSDEMTLEEMARRTGEPVERLRQWRSLGLIGAQDSERFRPEDVERERRLLERFVGLASQGRAGTTYPLAEAAEIVGLDLDFLRRVWAAYASAEQGDTVTEEDIKGLRLCKAAMEAGFPEEAMMQLVRVYADALGRVAEAEVRLFHSYVHERLRAEGLSGQQLQDATEAAGDRAALLTEPAILYFHRKGWERAVREDAVMHVAEEAGLLEKAEVPGQLLRAITFVDLSSFTPLAEAMGDVEAARVVERFSALVREAASRWEGRVVKQIGDAFMLVFPDPRSAVACALEIEARTEKEPQFPAARSGVHWGQVLYREGDYVGSNVNIAARTAAEAQRHQVLVTAAVRRQAKDLPDVEFVRLGRRRLKGLAQDLELFEARPSGVEGVEKAVDPVCGMELGPGEVVARLSLEGKEEAFCSDECLRRFVASPERYSP